MRKKYEVLAKSIIDNVGGKENVANVYHCQTRLRFQLIDEKKADTKAVEAIDGVAKVMINAGVYQVVIGTHVAEVFEEIEKLVDVKSEEAQTQQEQSHGIANTIIDFVAGTFQPIIPALSGAGMVKAVMALLVVFNLIDNTSQTYYMLNVFADGVFYFLPILIAFTEARKLKCNPILAAGVAAMMLHPNWLSLVTAADKVPVNFFGVIPFKLAGYASSVVPIILVVFVQSYVERILKKYIPKAVELVFVPMLTFLIMGTLGFSVLGPIGSVLGDYLAVFFTFLSTNASWAPAVLVGGLLPIMVMFGIHNGVAPLGVMQMADLGYDSIFGPGCVCSNMAQATSGLVITLLTKDKSTKQTAASGAITAYMGITEPILYGINLPKKYPLVAAMIGGGLGGLYAGLTHTHRFATGSSGLPAVLLYIGDDTMMYLVNILIAIAISIVVSGVLTFIFFFRFEGKEESKNSINEDNNNTSTITSETIFSPLDGYVTPIENARDGVFSSKVLGDGVAITPKGNIVYAPVNGTITALFPTKHAIGISSENGAEILIHIGIDTVKLNGEYFNAYVAQGDRVRAGDVLVSFDEKAILDAGYDTQTMVVVSNTDNYTNVKLVKEGQTLVKSKMLSLEVV